MIIGANGTREVHEPDTYARQAAIERMRLERAVDVLQGLADRNFIERERVRLALRALLTQPIAEALPVLNQLAREMNPDVPAPPPSRKQKAAMPENPPAFPLPIAEVHGRAGTASDFWPDSAGMSLRDYFAAKVLAGLLARSSTDVPHCDACRPVGDDPGKHYADIAYRYADAMLAERERVR